MKIIYIICLVLAAHTAHAACTGSSPSWSCSSWADAESLIEGASLQDGDTVTLAAGNYTASSTITIPSSKAITINGAGSGTSGTVITRDAASAINNGGSASTITNIRFVYNGSSGPTVPSVALSGKNWKIGNCYFYREPSSTSYGILAISSSAANSPAGVIYDCTFRNSRTVIDGANTFAEQHREWIEDANLGSYDAVYIEDCTFNWTYSGNCVDGNRGGRYVFRYNTVNDASIFAHGVQSQTNRGIRSWEIYGNTSHGTLASGLYIRVGFLRSGNGVIWGNTITGGWDVDTFQLDNRRSYNASPNICDGTQAMDENTPGLSGWLCRDQPGSGADVALSTWNGSSGTWQTQTEDKVYAWANTNAIALYGASGTHIWENRDFYDSHPWGEQTSSSSPFSGSSGVGRGIYDRRPSSCTTGVAYWATDRGGDWNTENATAQDGVLYKCTSNDTWTLWYTPYTYPHPLRSGETPPEPTHPTTVTITTESGAYYDTNSATITLEGTASDDDGLASVSYSNNRGGSGACTGTTNWTCADIAMSNGPNVITITAYDSGDGSGTDSTTVTYYIPVDDDDSYSVTGPQLVYFQATTPGNYKITGSVDATDQSTNSFFVDIDTDPAANNQKIWILDITEGYESQDVSWGWAGPPADAWYQDPVIWVLSGGNQILYIREREPGTLIQSVTFDNVAAQDPDSTAPDVTIATSDPQNITSDELTVTGTATDAVWGTGSVCKFRVGAAPDADNGTACTGTTSWTCYTEGYEIGANTLYIGCADNAENYSSGDTLTVYLAPVWAPQRLRGGEFDGGKIY